MQAALKNYRIYLDNCCVNRPFDDQTQNRIQRETAAIAQIFSHFHNGKWQWITSKILRCEIDQNPILKKRSSVNALLGSVPQFVCVSCNKAEVLRGKQLELLGFKKYDAWHLACAESGRSDVFLTTDDQVVNKARGTSSQLHVRVENPDTWLQEVLENECTHDDR